jgi:hypothetical protein
MFKNDGEIQCLFILLISITYILSVSVLILSGFTYAQRIQDLHQKP